MTGLKEAKRLASRKKVLTVATKLFRDLGYEAVTLRQIAGAAKFSTGVVFNHWPDGKDQLFTEAMGRPPLTDAQGARALAVVAEIFSPDYAQQVVNGQA